MQFDDIGEFLHGLVGDLRCRISEKLKSVRITMHCRTDQANVRKTPVAEMKLDLAWLGFRPCKLRLVLVASAHRPRAHIIAIYNSFIRMLFEKPGRAK